MQDVLALPIGSMIVENEGDRPRMTMLCRYGWTVVRGLSGGLVEMRRDFLRLYSQDELLAQLASPRSVEPEASSAGWLLIGLALFAFFCFLAAKAGH